MPHAVVVDLPPHPLTREKALLFGAECLSDAELLALVLGTGPEGLSALTIAANLLEASGGLGGVGKMGGHGLAEQRGIGPAKAARVLATLELGRRAAEGALTELRESIASFDAVVKWARPKLAPLEHEEVWLLTLDGRNGLRSAIRVAQGGVHGCALTPRDVLRPAVRDSASAIILLHNHPSGDPSPSAEDLRMTAALAVACEVVGIELLDHVVVARGGATSLRDLGGLVSGGS
jgi:DNA repair protein RadC